MTGIAVPTMYYPVAQGLLYIGCEKAGYAQAASNYVGIPVAGFEPSNKPQWLEDQALRGSMIKTYDLQQGPIWAEHTIPESPLYGDTIGHILYNLMGDYTTTGTASTPTWTTSGALSPGAGPIPVTTGTAAAAGTYVQIGTTTTAEIVKVGTGSTTTSIVVDASTPIRFNHLTGVAITSVVAPFTHSFSLLNLNSSTGLGSAQPPSHTLVHRNGLAGSGGNFSDVFLYGCFSEIKITGKSAGWITWDGKASSYSQSALASPITAGFSNVKGIPSWRSTNTIGGSPSYNVTEWSATFTREMDVVTPCDGQQNPYVIGRGTMTANFEITYDAASDETALNYMLNNSQPSLAWTATNGLTGANQVGFSIAAGLGGFKQSDLAVEKTIYGYKTSGELLGNTSNAGNSAGYSPAAITLTNSVPTY